MPPSSHEAAGIFQTVATSFHCRVLDLGLEARVDVHRSRLKCGRFIEKQQEPTRRTTNRDQSGQVMTTEPKKENTAPGPCSSSPRTGVGYCDPSGGCATSSACATHWQPGLALPRSACSLCSARSRGSTDGHSSSHHLGVAPPEQGCLKEHGTA